MAQRQLISLHQELAAAAEEARGAGRRSDERMAAAHKQTEERLGAARVEADTAAERRAAAADARIVTLEQALLVARAQQTTISDTLQSVLPLLRVQCCDSWSSASGRPDFPIDGKYAAFVQGTRYL